MITGAGHAENVVGLVYIAAFAPDEGEPVSDILARTDPAPGLAGITSPFEGFVWHAQDAFHDSFCQDLDDDAESLVMAVTQNQPPGGVSTFRPEHRRGRPSQVGTRSRPRTG